MPRSAKPQFEDLTETTGVPLTLEGASMMYTRYRRGAELARMRRVLEIGCGSGQGFGLLGEEAAGLVGADFSEPLLRRARAHFRERVPLARLSADRLPFRGRSFDLVLFFEASYYVRDLEAALDDIARVLTPRGIVLFVNANPQRPDFISSPHSIQYHTADEFRRALDLRGFEVTVEGAFPTAPDSAHQELNVKAHLLFVARKALSGLGLIPRTLRGRARLKRLIYGRNLPTVPPELPAGFAVEAPRTELPPGPVPGYKVIYITGTKR